jgi:hypothetical protein
MPKKIFALLVPLLIIFSVSAYPIAANQINFQGRLTTSAGVPIKDSRTVNFSLWTAVTGPSQVASDPGRVIYPDNNGVFNVILNFDNSSFDGNNRYLEIQVVGDSAMTPRQLITAVPYAYRAITAESVVGGNQWATSGSDIYNSNTGNVGIGTTNTTSKLTVVGTIETIGTGGVKFFDGTTQTTAAGAEDFVSKTGDKMTGTLTIEVSSGGAAEIGSGNVASGDNSVAMGMGSTASGPYAIAIGYNTTASAEASVAMGASTSATWVNSTAMGNDTTASGFASTAMGSYTSASGGRSTAMGYFTTASGDSSIAMGYWTTAQPYASLAIGRYNIVSGTPISWVDTEPLFIIGNGTNDGNRKNAMTVLKNGNVGIGTTEASGAKLVVKNGGDGLPGLRIITAGSKPAASADYRGAIFVEQGTPDVVWMCLQKNAAGTYQWVMIARGE